MTTKIQELHNFGQSVWYDNISRDIIVNGELKKLLDVGIVGLTSNPSIFEKAIGVGTAYDEQIRELVAKKMDAPSIFGELAIHDIREAADIFRPVYERTNGTDGFVSIEVSPLLAHDTKGTLEDAHHFYDILARPNIMIKVPATPEGIPAIEALIGEGVNVNVTLIFALDAYKEVAHAYIRGLRKLKASGKKPLDRVSSVASFFVSRVDTLVDKWIEEKIAASSDENQKKELEGLLGKAAIANAKLAYEEFKKIFEGPEFADLQEAGAHKQRVLWASTSAKNPKYRDVLYAEELVGPHTVDTMPAQTIEAFMDHGNVGPTLDAGYEEAHRVFDTLEKDGISMEKATAQLLADGVKLFADAFDKLILGVDEKRKKLAGEMGQKEEAVR